MNLADPPQPEDTEGGVIYNASMRTTLLLALLCLAATGCRTTHEADSAELAQLSSVDSTFETSGDVSSDFGQLSVSSISAVYAPLQWLSDKDRDEGTSSYAILHSQEELNLLPTAGFLLEDGTRDEWPECLTEGDNSVTYNDCVLGVGTANVMVGFAVDGSYAWTDNSSTSELFIDFGVEAVGLTVGSSFDWAHDFEWTDTKLDGSFNMDYVSGVLLGGAASATSASLGLSGTVDELVTDDTCDGPVSGVMDWRARYRAGLDPVEVTRVTVEWTGCEEALVTW